MGALYKLMWVLTPFLKFVAAYCWINIPVSSFKVALRQSLILLDVVERIQVNPPRESSYPPTKTPQFRFCVIINLFNLGKPSR
jgi:hypothetical protein